MGKKTVVAAIGLAMGMLTAGVPVAQADDGDMFVQRLERSGIDVSDVLDVSDDDAAGAALDLAETTCDLQSQGYRDYDVHQVLIGEHPDADSNKLFTMQAVGTLMYCPEYLG